MKNWFRHLLHRFVIFVLYFLSQSYLQVKSDKTFGFFVIYVLIYAIKKKKLFKLEKKVNEVPHEKQEVHDCVGGKWSTLRINEKVDMFKLFFEVVNFQPD